MAKKWLCLALAIGLGLGGVGLWQRSAVAAQQPAKDREHVEQLVKQLGSAKFAEREKARHELENIGMPALEQLRQAAKTGDLEISSRCQELVKKLESKISAEGLLAPKKVHLKLNDVSVLQAVEELQKQSGYSILVEGDRTALAKRKITLDTGEVPFLQAFDMLCAKGQLVEIPTANNNPSAGYYGPAPIRQPIKLQPPLPPGPPLPVQPGLPAPPVGKQLPPAPQPKGGALPVPPVMQLDVELPAIGGNPKEPAGQVRIMIQAQVVQIGQPGQGGQGGAGGAPGQPGQAGQGGFGGAGGAGGAPGQPGQAGQGGFGGGIGNPAQPALPAQPIQPGKALPQPAPGIQIQPIGSGAQPGMPAGVTYYPPGVLVVKDGTPAKLPTFYHGALRIRLLPASRAAEFGVQPQQQGEALFLLEVTPEPRLQGFTIVGSPRVEKSVDNIGQQLTLAMEPMGNPNVVAMQPRVVYYAAGQSGTRVVALRMKLGEKKATEISQLNGNLTVQALSEKVEALIKVDDVMKAAGKMAKGQDGGAIEVLSIEKQNDGTYRAVVRFEQPPVFRPGTAANFNPGGGVVVVQMQVQPNPLPVQPGKAVGGPVKMQPSSQGLPVLVTADGKAFEIVQIPNNSIRAVDGKITREMTMIFRAPAGGGEPASMVLLGRRLVTAQVPFQFENIWLK